MLITAKDNRRVKQYIKLTSSKRERDLTGFFCLEGVRGCVDLIRLGGIEVEALFYTEEAVERLRGTVAVEYLENFDSSRKFLITPEVAAKMSGVEKPQGAFIIAKKPHRSLEEGTLNPSGKYLVLCGLQDPGNLGTMLRTAAAVGINGVVLTGGCVDLYNPKVVRSAVGSMAKTNIYIEKDFRRVTSVMESAGIKTCAAVVSGGEEVRCFDFSGGCAVVIGNEGRGLSPEQQEMCQKKVTIEMKGDVESLNAAIAATILIWEMSR